MMRPTLPSCGLLLVIGCAGPTDPLQDTRRAVLSDLADRVAVAQYADLAEHAATLATVARQVCAAPDAARLSDAQAAWWATRGAWKRAEIVQFGPVVEYPERLGPKLDDWPVNARAVEDLVASELDLDLAAFDAMGSSTRGLPVAEYLLYGDDAATALADTRRCEVLVGVTEDIARNATSLHDAWTGGWRDRVASPQVEADSATPDAYDTPQDVLDEWVNRMAFTVENIRSTKLGKPAGDTSGGDPLLDALESRLSGRSVHDARDALAGVSAVLHGSFADDAAQGIGALLIADNSPELVSQLTADLQAADQRLGQIPDPLELSILAEPELIPRAQEALLAAQVLLQVDIAQALGVTITFNDNDGD